MKRKKGEKLLIEAHALHNKDSSTEYFDLRTLAREMLNSVHLPRGRWHVNKIILQWCNTENEMERTITTSSDALLLKTSGILLNIITETLFNQFQLK